jgi:hypothetical protein
MKFIIYLVKRLLKMHSKVITVVYSLMDKQVLVRVIAFLDMRKIKE